jgi:hypothetical protein
MAGSNQAVRRRNRRTKKRLVSEIKTPLRRCIELEQSAFLIPTGVRVADSNFLATVYAVMRYESRFKTAIFVVLKINCGIWLVGMIAKRHRPEHKRVLRSAAVTAHVVVSFALEKILPQSFIALIVVDGECGSEIKHTTWFNISVYDEPPAAIRQMRPDD